MLGIRLQAECTVKQRYILAVVWRRSDVGKLVGLQRLTLAACGFKPPTGTPLIGQCTAERRGSPGFASSSPERLVYFGLHIEAGGQVALADLAKHRQLMP